jgi:hypothetical protein
MAFILAAAALGLTLYRELEDPILIPTKPQTIVQAAEPDPKLQEELLKLRMRLATLEKALAEKEKQFEPVPILQEEVAELSSFQNDLAEYALNIDPLDVIGATEREIENAYNALLDESLPAAERAKQAALLKKYNLFDEDAVASMSAMFFNANDSYEKAAALSALKGYITPEVRQGVMEAFSNDIAEGYKNGRLRYSGIEALEPLLPDPEVEAMLKVIAQNDPEVRIANRAAKSVGLPARQKTDVRPKDG